MNSLEDFLNRHSCT